MNLQKYSVVLVTVLLCSCTKEFLDVNNTQELFRESYVKDLPSMQEYVRGVHFIVGYNIEAGEANATYTELAADNLRPFSGTSAAATTAIYNWAQTGTATPVQNMNPLWKSCYHNIRMCNFIIDHVDEYRAEDAKWADNMKGQALAIRALVYCKLINVYAQPYTFTNDASHPGVPYITTADITQSYTRQTVAEVYTGMINDLKRAMELLPETVTDVRYMNRLAVKALLARIYLFKEDFANAKMLAAEIMNLVPLMTIAAGYPNDLFKYKTPSGTEILFQLGPTSGSSLGRYVRRGPVAYSATNDLAKLLTENPNDIRRNWIKDTTVGGSTLRLVKKFPVSVTPEIPLAANPDLAYYTSILRSSEMALILAETAAKTGDENTARTWLNAIRKRADPSLAAANPTGQALVDSIYKERRKELSFEGLRMFDLQRWKAGVQRTDVLPGTPNNLAFPNDKAIAPIPLEETRLAGIPQNKGY